MAEPTRYDIDRSMCDSQWCRATIATEKVGEYVRYDDYATLQNTLRAILTAYDALNAGPSIGDPAKRAAFVAAVDAARGCV